MNRSRLSDVELLNFKQQQDFFNKLLESSDSLKQFSNTPPNAAGIKESLGRYKPNNFILGEGSPLSSIPKGQNLITLPSMIEEGTRPNLPIESPFSYRENHPYKSIKSFSGQGGRVNTISKSAKYIPPVIEGTAPSNYNPVNISYKSALTSGLPNSTGIRFAPSPDLNISNILKQFGSSINNLAKTSTPALETIGNGLKFANKAFPVVNLGLESMNAASDISANPQMSILDKISRYGEAAGNSFGIPLPEMANSTINMLTGLDQETASQKLAREQGDKTNYQYAVGAMSEADANNLATGQDEYTKNHPTYPSQMINRNLNMQQQQPIVTNTNNYKPLVNVPKLTSIGGIQSNIITSEQLQQQPKTNILGEQVPTDQLPKGVGYVNGKLFDSNTQSTKGMFDGYSKERDASLNSYGKVDKNSDFYKRNKQAMSNLGKPIEEDSQVQQQNNAMIYNNPTSASVDFKSLSPSKQRKIYGVY